MLSNSSNDMEEEEVPAESVQEVPDTIKDGLLWKRGRFRHSWKLRYVVLTDQGLRYYDGSRFKGELKFNENSQVEIQPPGLLKTGHSGSTNFRFVVSSETRSLLCAARTEAEMHEWTEAVKIATRRAGSVNASSTETGGEKSRMASLD